MSEVEAVPAVEAARKALEDAKSALKAARAQLNDANHALASMKVEDYESEIAWQKASAKASSAVQAAEYSIKYRESKVSAAESALAPLELEELRGGVKGALAARALALQNLNEAMRRLAAQFPYFRESVALVREAQGAIERDFAELERRGARSERPAEDELATYIARHVPDNLDADSAALSACLAMLKWLEGAPQREAERAETQRRIEAERRRTYNEECCRGEHGPEEQRRALEESREWAARFYSKKGPAHIMTTLKGSPAHAELERMRKNAGLTE